MPYRAADGFSWNAARSVHTARVFAAVALVAAGWVFGFFSGRLSAWVFPVADPDVVALKATLEHSATQRAAPTALAPSDRPTSRAGEEERPTLALSPPPDAGRDQQAQALSDKKNEAVPAPPRVAEEPETSNEEPQPKTVLVNPDWRASAPAPKEPDPVRMLSRDDNGRTAECARRYLSFRASDGTYQPFGRASRELCPLLR